MSSARGPLFGVDAPPGFRYRDDFITPAEESALADHISPVAFFGRSYDSAGAPVSPLPAFLMPLRERMAAWAEVGADAFAMALVNEYPSGAPIGWHRDAPQYDVVAGVSLLSSCRMKLRPYVSPATRTSTSSRRTATHEIPLERRSAYMMSGPSRTDYEHHIPPVRTLRYSITFRTLRDA